MKFQNQSDVGGGTAATALIDIALRLEKSFVSIFFNLSQ